MINLKIDPEFQSQIPPLTDDEFKQLEENILKEGKLCAYSTNTTHQSFHAVKDERIEVLGDERRTPQSDEWKSE